jgi:multidrug efflux pump subunit AcrA (membrane-fusion protein)
LVHTRNPLRILLLVPAMAIALASCKPAEQSAAAQPRPVRGVTVARQEGGEKISLSGQIEAETEVSLSFRVGGRVIQRPVNIGDRVKGGQVVARLEPEPAENELR